MATEAEALYSPEDYLAMERRAEYKSEYIAGRIYQMAGASREHSLIVFNLARLIGNQLSGRPCEAYVTDMRVKLSSRGGYVYPDAAIVCGEPLFEDAELDTLTNPTVICEVLSPSTESYDRGLRFAQYRTLATVTDYVLVSRDRMLVEHYTRQGEGGDWLFREHNSPDDLLDLASIGASLRLSDMYDRIDLPAQTAE